MPKTHINAKNILFKRIFGIKDCQKAYNLLIINNGINIDKYVL